MLMTGTEVLNECVELIKRGRAVSGAHEAGLFLAIEWKGWLVCRAGPCPDPLTVIKCPSETLCCVPGTGAIQGCRLGPPQGTRCAEDREDRRRGQDLVE